MAEDFSKIIESVDGVSPSQQDVKQVEEYKPSSLPGYVAGAGVLGGLGALVAGRVPGLKTLSRIASKTKPIPQAPRITEPVVLDKVDEIITVVPTKIDRATDTIKSAKPMYLKIMDDFEKVKQTSIQQPLTMGGTKGRFGSALYDFIAQHPSKKSLSPDAWINEFKNFNRLSEFKVNVPGTKVKGSISKEELFDTNIARFNNKNELVGGFLKVAQESNLPVSKLDLLKLVEKSPAANLKVRRFSLPSQMADEAEYLSDMVYQGREAAKLKIDALPSTSPNLKSDLRITLNSLTQDFMENLSKASVRYREGHTIADYNSPLYKNRNDFDKLKEFARNYKNTNKEDLFEPGFLETLEQRSIALDRTHQAEKGKGLYPRYGSQTEYKITGAEKYFEDVAYYPNPIPYRRDIDPGHFGSINGEPFKNQLYHVRYGQRSLEGNPNKKVYSIDEMQSDVQQKAFANDPTRAKVTNPFNTEAEFQQANVALDNLKNQMKVIADKGDKITQQDTVNYYKLSQKFDELRANTINASNIGKKTSQYTDGSTPYMPMFGRDVWGDHALKNVMKSAAENNVEWVVVNPVERLHVKRNVGSDTFGKLGNWEFYGGVDGMAGRKGLKATSDERGKILTNSKQTAVIPERMKQLAKQYNTEAKTIRVSLSDPNKPFKVIRDTDYDNATIKKLGLNPKTVNEHIGAFKTAREAEVFASSHGGRMTIMDKNDPDLYYEAFGIKITPEMKGTPFKLYKKEGGLVVNIFA